MLPSRSKRYATADSEIPRLALTSPWHLGLIAVLVLTLLVVIFPNKALLDTLYQQHDIDPLSMSYIQNLYRVETSNLDVALLLARGQGKNRNIQSLEPILLRVTVDGTARQRQEAYSILFESYCRELALPMVQAEKSRQTQRLAALLGQASKDDLPAHILSPFAAKSFELGLPQTGLAFLEKLNMHEPLRELEALGSQALARGQYEAAASYFLLARDQAHSTNEARRLFQKGIETYMAANLFQAAMQAAVQRVGDLDADLPTLRFLSRTAMAAGDPARAASFARKLVFSSGDGVDGP